MRRKDILFPLIALILVVFYFATGKKNEVKTEYLIDKDINIEKIHYKSDDLDIVLKKKNKKWFLEKPEEWPVNSTLINNLVDKLKDTEVVTTIEKGEEKQYGLDKGEYIELNGKDKNYKIVLGKKDKSYRLQYVKLDGDEKILLVDASFTNYLPLTVNQIKDKTVYSFNDEVVLYDLKFDNESLKVEKNGEIFVLNGKEVAKEKVDELKKLISKLEANTFADDNKLPDSAKKVGYLKVKTSNDEFSFDIYKDKEGDFYIPFKGQVFEIYSFNFDDILDKIKKLVE
ncbi:DUF4340 domain-containing protein [Deferribacter autotrophicus]|uniref:DUF4340 domain-containing protein n=1 Tax=Deferribacter autotrophicus TaxID=500465 RepID=A0A5A8F3A4_9BACT|nr:DUF4340 domain-containing protein [Deferribacter autotrophicus]KAA0257996.1 DUF4340 domain-containing protein [Deferribacter autotrophicus]